MKHAVADNCWQVDIDWVGTEVFVPHNTKLVISETLIPANFLASTDEHNKCLT